MTTSIRSKAQKLCIDIRQKMNKLRTLDKGHEIKYHFYKLIMPERHHSRPWIGYQTSASAPPGSRLCSPYPSLSGAL